MQSASTPAMATCRKFGDGLRGQGFQIESTGHSRDRITFSGSADQVASTFGTSLHQYRTLDGIQFGPASELSLPSDLAPLVTAVLHLSDVRPKSNVKLGRPLPQYTTAEGQDYYLDPLDLAVQYDIQPLYNAGVTGSGQTIAIVGQSAWHWLGIPAGCWPTQA